MMTALLLGVSAPDPLTFGEVAVLLTAAALLGSYLPSRRASGVEPIDSLRQEWFRRNISRLIDNCGSVVLDVEATAKWPQQALATNCARTPIRCTLTV